MTTTLAIKDWNEVFEDRRSRAVSRLHFLVCRVLDRKSEAYACLVALPGGVEAYGVFWALILVAARCPTRGILADEKGILTPVRLAARTRMPADVIERSIDLLTRPDVGWLVRAVSAPSARRPRAVESDESDARSPLDPPSERREDGGNGHCAPSARATNTLHNPTTTATSTGVAAAAAVIHSGGEAERERAGREAYLRKRPEWMPEGKPWISRGMCGELSRLPLSIEDVDEAYREGRECRLTADNPAGIVIAALRKAASGMNTGATT